MQTSADTDFSADIITRDESHSVSAIQIFVAGSVVVCVTSVDSALYLLCWFIKKKTKKNKETK